MGDEAGLAAVRERVLVLPGLGDEAAGVLLAALQVAHSHYTDGATPLPSVDAPLTGDDHER